MEIFNNLKKNLREKKELMIQLKVIANSSCLQFQKLDEVNNYKLKITKLAEKGKANLEIIKVFKNNLKPLKVEIEIKSGQTSNFKKLKINLIK